MRIAILLILAGWLIIAGCGTDASGPSADPDYFPISIGNQWDYDVDGYLTNTKGDTLTVDGSYVREVTKTVTHESGLVLFELVSSFSMSVQFPDTVVVWSDTSYSYTFDADSELIAYDDTLTSDFEIVMKFPPVAGETWEPFADSTVIREVVSLSSSISVPSGNYTDCIHLRDTDTADPDFLWNMYVAEGIGPASFVIEEADSNSFSHMEIELESFLIN